MDFSCCNPKERLMSNMRQQRTQKRPLQKYRKRQQYGGFLKRYDFAYTGRDTVNQLGKVAPGIIKTTSTEINDIAQQRINQILSPGEKEIDGCYRTFSEEPWTTSIKHHFVCCKNSVDSSSRNLKTKYSYNYS